MSERAWQLVDEEAARSLRHFLSARTLVDFTGPSGWDLSAVPTGTVVAADPPADGVVARRREATPVVELRTPFDLDWDVVDAVDRGSDNPDLAVVTEAARRAAMAEDRTLFDGGDGMEGMAASSSHEPLVLGDDYGRYPSHVASAVAVLRRAGVEGPYAIALGDRCYTGVIETTEHGGYPVLEHVRLILGGPVIWAPALDGALVVSIRGGDYEMFSGGDLAVGFVAAGPSGIGLYIEESFAFQVHEPAAAVALRYA
jgi:uncharacterized linocin/CFP29 family protein